VLGDQLRLEGAGAVPRHLDAQRALVGQHRLAAAAVAVVAPAAVGVGQVHAQLRPQRPLDHGLLQALKHRLDPGGVHRTGDELLEKLLGQVKTGGGDLRFLLAWHTCSLAASWYAPHTKFLTPSNPVALRKNLQRAQGKAR